MSDDKINGGEGNDTIFAGIGNDIVNGGIGHDLIFGGDGFDTLFGDGDDDFVSGGANSDSIDGGSGNDTLHGGAGGDVLVGGAGLDSASYSSASEGVFVDLSNTSRNTGDAIGDTFSSIEHLIGSNFADQLRATGEANVVFGGGGNDFVIARSGDDIVYGEAGSDRLEGGNGDDTLYGGVGADTLNGGEGTDFASYANAGVGVTADMSGALANTGDAAGDTYVSIEVLIGSDHGDVLGSLHQGTKLIGGLGDDTLNGNNGNDTLEGGAGADALNGGIGTDTATYQNATSRTTVDLGNASRNTGEAYGDFHTSIENLIGSAFNDDLRASGDANVIFSGGGDDFILGRSGNDSLNGGDGADRLEGGKGNDTLEGGAGNDTLTGGDGVDAVSYSTATERVSVDLSNPSQNTGEAAGDVYVSIEDIVGSSHNDALRGTGGDNSVSGGGGNDFILGRSGHDQVHGNDGDDRIEGGGGDDTLSGGAGLDLLTGGLGADTFVFVAGDTAVDQVTDFNLGLDLLDISAWGASSTSDLSILATPNGGNFDVSVGYSLNSFELIGLSQNSLSDSDFVFV